MRDGDRGVSRRRLLTIGSVGAAVVALAALSLTVPALAGAAGRPRSAAALPTAPPSAPSVAPAAPCQAQQLRLHVRRGGAGGGQGEIIFDLQNVGGQTCAMSGYPGFVDRGADQRQVPAAHRPGRTSAVTLRPGGIASFYLTVSNVCSQVNPARNRPDPVEITPPGSTTALAWTFPDGAFCEDAAYAVSPVYAGPVSMCHPDDAGCRLATPAGSPAAAPAPLPTVPVWLQRIYAGQKAAEQARMKAENDARQARCREEGIPSTLCA